MAKKAELLEQARKLKLDVSPSNTIAEIEAALKSVELDSKTSAKIKQIVDNEEAPTDKPLAKAGKRSEKQIKETAEKIAKEERKQVAQPNDSQATEKKKGPSPITRSLLERRGKKYRQVHELVDKAKYYNLSDALELATKTNPAKFDASVEMHIRLDVDPRQADQNIRATVILPKGSGKNVRVAVLAPESEHANLQKAKADIVGDESLLKMLDNGELNFDVLITTPQYMPKLGKYARSLGPKGLMPNPKNGSVTTNLVKAVAEAKAGKVEYRVDKQSIVHLSIGKVSFGASDLLQNAEAFFDSLKAQKPSSLKGSYVKTINISTSMGPNIKVENNIN